MIMSAVDVKEYSKMNRINKNKSEYSELEVIENAINYAVSQGENFIILNFICSPMAIKQLQDNHYKINGKNFTTYINW